MNMRHSNPPLYNQSYLNIGHGPVVILLQGLFGNLGMWKSTIEALKDNFRVIVPRLPIFDLPIQHTNVKYLAKVLHEFIEWNELSNVTLVGHALGGQVALLYTAQHPANVRRIVLSASAGLLGKYPLADGPTSGFDDLEFVQEQVEAAFFEPGKTPVELVNDIFSTVKSIPKRITLDTLSRSSHQSNVASLLNRLDHATLLIWGLDDKITPPEMALHFHDFLLNSEIRFIEKCGHVPMIEQPETFNRHVLEFLRKGR
jgi:2-hydroxy-6-oxonona-2,4-dienedioate hydrolase